MRARQSMIVLGGSVLGMAAYSWVASNAQAPAAPDARPAPAKAAERVEVKDAVIVRGASPAPTNPADPRPAGSSIQQALLQPYHLPFSKATTLEAVRDHLKKTLGVPVVLDLAALDRLDLKPDDTVQLEIDGVRLKTALQLLLDQVGLTYRVVAEDNLLVLTDKEGSDDPLAKIWAEIRELHRDIHEVQDSIDDLTDLLVPEGADLQMRKPTIIEEMPESQDPKEKPATEAEAPAEVAPGSQPPRDHQPGRRSGGRIKPAPPTATPAPSPPAEDAPARVPLGRSRKRA